MQKGSGALNWRREADGEAAPACEQASLPGQEEAPGVAAAVVGTDYLRTVATMDRLRDTLRDEHSFLVQFMLTVWRRCLTPFQAANLHIQARCLTTSLS